MAKTDVNSTICITTGEPGAGKTLSRGVIYSTEVYLRDKIGIMYHNLPLKHDLIADYMHKKYKKDRTEILNRLHYINESITDEWVQNCFFTYFTDKDLHNAFVLIDEAHKYFGRNNLTGNAQLIKDTEKALSEFRHNGAKLEIMTQSYKSIHKTVRDRCGYAISIINFQDYNDIIFGIKMRDWMQLKAKLIGNYTSASLQVENKVMEDKFLRITTKIWWHNPIYYTMYNTNNGSDGSNGAETEKLKDDWQLKNWPQLIFWFLRRNIFNLFIGSKIAIISWLLIFFIFLGPKNLINAWVKHVESALIKPKNVVGDLDHSNDSKNNTKNELNVDNQELKNLKKKNEELENKLKDFESSAKLAVQKLKKDKSITLIDNEGIMLFDGSYFRINNIIDFGFLKGKKIEKVDVRQNRVYFDDGTIITVGNSLYEKVGIETGINISESVRDEQGEKRNTGNPEFKEVGEISNRRARSSSTDKLSSE